MATAEERQQRLDLASRVAAWLQANAAAQKFSVETHQLHRERLDLTFAHPSGAVARVWIAPSRPDEPSFSASGRLALGFHERTEGAATERLMQSLSLWLKHLAERGALDSLFESDDAAERPAGRLYRGSQVEVRTTLACNFDCLFCNSDEGDVANAAHSPERALAISRAAFEEGATTLVVSGGEPTVLPWLPEYLAAAGGLGFQRIVLQTNGSRLASGALLESLKRVPALELLVSLPASNQPLLERLAGPHASLQAIVDGIRRAVDSGIAVEVNHVVCKPGLQDVGNIAPFLRREFAQGVQRLIYSFIAPTGRAAGAGADLVPRYSDAASPVVAAMRAARDLGFLARMPEYCGIPACINPGLHEFAEPQRHSESLEVPAGKFKFAHCPTCRLNARCSGVFGRYIDLFGRAEFSNVA